VSELNSTNVQSELRAIHDKLDRLDDAIRGTPGNGTKPGIQTRLDRLEQAARRHDKLAWLAIGTAATAIATWLMTVASSTGGV
jgi:hypothetical protein